MRIHAAIIGLSLTLAAAFPGGPLAARDAAPLGEAAIAAMRSDLESVYQAVRPMTEGENASYIPELAKVDPALFGIAVATVDGQIISVGDAQHAFTVQSAAKPFTLALALADHGSDAVPDKVGTLATGLPFNSLLGAEVRATPLQNPLVNAGAMATVSLVTAPDRETRWRRVRENLSAFAGVGAGPGTGGGLELDQPTFASEMATNAGNLALANQLRNKGLFYAEVADAVDVYTRQGSLLVTAEQLAVMGATLANGGVNPLTGAPVTTPRHARDILSVMLVAGLYDAMGEWIYRVGLPAKSGVGGGIVAVVPGRFAIATFSPPLDPHGNSARGVAAIEKLAEMWALHPFDMEAR